MKCPVFVVASCVGNMCMLAEGTFSLSLHLNCVPSSMVWTWSWRVSAGLLASKSHGPYSPCPQRCETVLSLWHGWLRWPWDSISPVQYFIFDIFRYSSNSPCLLIQHLDPRILVSFVFVLVHCIINKWNEIKQEQGMEAHSCLPSVCRAGAGGSQILRLVWAIQWDPVTKHKIWFR